MILDFIGTIVLIMVTIINISAIATAMPLPPARTLVFAAAAGLWVGLQVALAGSGAFAGRAAGAFQLIGVMVVVPPLLVLVATRLLPAFRTALLAIPTGLLVALNASRVLGAFFLFLAAAGRLGGPFPQSAGWGDIITGTLAIPLAVALLRGRRNEAVLAAWNLFGFLDLVAAASLGLLSANGSPLQLIAAGAGSSAVIALPWSLIPTVAVPFYLIVHGLILAQQRAGREQRAGSRGAPGSVRYSPHSLLTTHSSRSR
jgi:hypothetical protein